MHRAHPKPSTRLNTLAHNTPNTKHTHSVIVLDLPGHGQSPVPPGDPDLDTLVSSAVEAVQRALAELGDGGGADANDKVVLFGNSLGGLVGCRVALAMPERVLGLCLASPAGEREWRCVDRSD